MDLAFLCCLAVGVLMAAVFTVGIVLAAVRNHSRQRAGLARLDALLDSLGLERIPGSPWRQGVVDGVPLVARASRRISLGLHGVQGDERFSVGLEVMVPVELPLVGGRVARQRKARGTASTFDTAFYGEVGGSLDAVSPEVAQALLERSEQTDDDLALVDRHSRAFLAGAVLPEATVVLAVEPRKPIAAGELGTWLRGVAAFARELS